MSENAMNDPAFCTSLAARCGRRPVVAVLVAWLAVAPCALASNGLNLIGFGAESIGMAGADISVARDTTALNTNPAGLSQIDHIRTDQYFVVAHALDIRHKDAFGNDGRIDNRYAALGDIGVAKRLSGTAVTIGAGVFAQGGAGIEYNRLITPFGGEDELSIGLRIARISPGLAWAVDDRLSLGVAAFITYADLDQKIFPDTSFAHPTDPAMNFFGLSLDDASTIEPGFKLGAMYRLSGRVTLGASYTSEVKLTMDGGTATLDMSAIGLGKVTYRDAVAGGIDQPREVDIGASFWLDDGLLIATEVSWIDWSDAVRRTFLELAGPDNPMAPPVLKQTTELNWRDQYVFALGLAWDWSDALVLRGGVNIANNPVPEASISPILAPITRYHVTAGIGYRPAGAQWRVDGAVEYQVRESQVYTNPQLPFGPDAKTELESLALHVMVSQFW